MQATICGNKSLGQQHTAKTSRTFHYGMLIMIISKLLMISMLYPLVDGQNHQLSSMMMVLIKKFVVSTLIKIGILELLIL